MSTAAYSRLCYVAIKKETTEGVAVIPNVFVPVLSVDIVPKYDPSISMPVVGKRTMNIRGVPNAIAAPTGKITMNVEPRTAGHFLLGAYGVESVGRYMQVYRRLLAGVVTGTPVVGATLAQAVTLATATVGTLGAANAYFDLRSTPAIGSFDATNVVTGTNPDGTTFTFTPSAVMNGAAFQVGETVTGASSSSTAVVSAVSSEGDYLLTAAFSAPFTAGETITGGTSSGKGVVGTPVNTVYGHQFLAPGATVPTYTVELGYVNEAIRLTGCRFNGWTSNQKNNIITGEVALTARAEFKHAYVTAITTTGVGTKAILVDQTTGLVSGDVIKVFRPSTGAYFDFASTGVKTNTITGINSETSIQVTGVFVQIQVGDLIELAPQTASYNTDKEFTWVGGSTSKVSDTSISAAVLAPAVALEDFEVAIINDVESRHAALGANIINRFPAANYLKGLKGSGKMHIVYTDPTFADRLRKNRDIAVSVLHTGVAIGATAATYLLDYRAPDVILGAFSPKIDTDNLLDQEMPYTIFDSASSGYTHKALLVNDITAY